MEVVLGLDPGSRYTGWGVIARRGRRLEALAHGRIVLPRGAPLPSRLGRLADELGALLERHQPSVAVLEALFRGVNVRSLIVLAQARGAILTTLAVTGVPIHEFSPAEVKSAVTGHGRADKEQVARMVRMVLGLGRRDLSPDESDALAAGICYAQRLRLDRLAGA